ARDVTARVRSSCAPAEGSRPAPRPPAPAAGASRLAIARATTWTARARTTSTSASTPPTAAATKASPSARVCGGTIARASPSWAPWATTWQPTLSSVALVATTPTVVLPKRVRREPAAARAVAMSRARLSSAPGTPAAFTTTSAATTRSPARAPAVTTPPGRRGGSSPGAGRVALLRARPHGGVAHGQVDQAEGDDDRHRAGGRRHAHAPLLAEPHDAVRRGQPERRAAGHDDRVQPGDRPGRVEQGGLPGGRGAAPHLARGDGALGQQHHGAAGRRPPVGPVAHPHAGDVGDHDGPPQR